MTNLGALSHFSLALHVGPGGLTAILSSVSHLHSSQLSCLSFLDSASETQGSSSYHPGALGASCSGTHRDIPALCWAVSGVIQRTRGWLSSALSLPKPIWGFPVSQHHIPGQVRRGQRVQISFLRELPVVIFITVSQPSLDFPPPSKAEDRLLGSRVGKLALIYASEFFVIVVVFCVLRVPPRPERFFSLSNLRKFVFKGINENFSWLRWATPMLLFLWLLNFLMPMYNCFVILFLYLANLHLGIYPREILTLVWKSWIRGFTK